jgi:hypothetical protein
LHDLDDDFAAEDPSDDDADDPFDDDDTAPTAQEDTLSTRRTVRAPRCLIEEGYNNATQLLHPTPSSRSILGYFTPFCHDDLFLHSLD